MGGFGGWGGKGKGGNGGCKLGATNELAFLK